MNSGKNDITDEGREASKIPPRIESGAGSDPPLQKGGTRRRASIIIPLLFFALGVAAAMGYSHWTSKVKSGDATMTSAAEKKEPKILYWVDPMNPSNKTDKPGKAPCGMDMVPVYAEEQSSGGEAPAGSIKISPEKQQLIGVQFGEAAEMNLSKTIRAVGRAAYDETRVAHVHTKFPGWVDTVYVDFVGKLVKKGQPLLSIYSPELLATQQELLIAKKSRDTLQDSQFEGIGARAKSLYKSTRERLRLWDISDAQINEVERRDAPLKSLTLTSVLNGFVINRNVFSGQQVSPELELYTIADLSNVWIMAEIYEYELPTVHMGQSASVSFPSFPGKTFAGKITYISPELDPKTRTVRVRVELPNADFKIKPDMFANVELKMDYGKKLSIPQEAVLDSGSNQVVFVSRDDGYFEPRKVTLGAKVDDRFIVSEGLKAGERVVTSANFLIDSESQLKSATGGMGGMEGMPGMAAGGANAGQGGSPAEGGEQVLKPANPAPDHSGHGQM